MKSQPFATKWRVVFSLFASCGIFALPAHAATCSGSMPTGPTAYVATSPNLVTVLDASSNAVACTVTVGTQPTNLAVSPDGSQLFAENNTDATVSVIDLTTGAVTSTIDLSTAVSASKPMTANLAVSPDGTSVWVVVLPQSVVSGTTKPALYIISLPSLTATAATNFNTSASLAAVTGAGLGIAFSTDGATAYIATEGQTYVVATSTNSISSSSAVNGVTVVTDPAHSPSSFAYVVDVAGTVSEIAASPYAPLTVTGCTAANSSAITPDGGFDYYTCTSSDLIHKIAIGSKPSSSTVTLASGAGPQGIAITSDNVLVYVANSNGSVSVASVSGNPPITPVTSLGALSGIAFRPVQLSQPSPATASVPTGTTQQFSSTVSYAFGGGVSRNLWAVNGTVGGDINTVGSISTSGLYTAPNTIPSPAQVTVSVTSTESLPFYRTHPFTATVTIAPSKLAFTVEPTNGGMAGSPLATVTVSVEDASSNVITTGLGSNASITITSAATPTTPPAAPVTTTVTATAGVATFSNLILTQANIPPLAGSTTVTPYTYTLTATSTTPGLTSALSSSFTILPATATKLVFTAGPAPVGSVAGTPLFPGPGIVVAVEDAFNNVVTSGAGSNASITIGSSASPTPPAAAVGGTTMVSAAGGVATFSNLILTQANIPPPSGSTTVTPYSYTIMASAGASLTSPPSNPFEIAPATAAKLAFTTQPANGTAGSPLALIVVAVEDGFGNVATSSPSVPITITSASTTPVTPPAAPVGGTTIAIATNGVATFSNLILTQVGTTPSGTPKYNYTLTALSGPLAPATSTPTITIAPGAPTQLFFNAQPVSGATAGSALAPVIVYIEDAFSNVVTGGAGSNALITMTPTSTPSGIMAFSGGSNQVVAVGGVATFNNLILTQANIPPPSGSTTVTPYSYTMAAVSSSPPLASPPSNPFAISSAAATKLVYTTQPANGTAAVALGAADLAVEDTFGNVVTSGPGSNASITLISAASATTVCLAPGALPLPPPPPAIAGATGGVATFSGLTFSLAGSYTLTAQSALPPSLLVSVASSSFTIAAGAAAQLVFKTEPVNGTAGIALAPVVVCVDDADNNIVTDPAVPASKASIMISSGSVPSGAAGVAGTTTVNASAGVAIFNNLVLSQVGTTPSASTKYNYTLTATSGPLTPASSTPAITIVAGPAAKLAFAGSPAGNNAGLAVQNVSVFVEDASNNIVTDPAVAASTASITISSSSTPGGAASVSGTPTVAASGGVATFNNLTLTQVGTTPLATTVYNYALAAKISAPGALTGLTTATSSSFTITPGTAAQLAFAQPLASGATLAGSPLPGVAVYVEDAFSNVVKDPSVPASTALIMINSASSPTGAAAVAGLTTVPASGGVATFGNLMLTNANIAPPPGSTTVTPYSYTLAATSVTPSLTSALSNSFSILPAMAAKLVYTTEPANGRAGVALGTVNVAVEDAFSNVVTSGAVSNASITITSAAAPATPPAAPVGGTTVVAAVGGVATFGNLMLTQVGTMPSGTPPYTYTLTANSAGLTGASSSPAITIAPGSPAQLAFGVQPTSGTPAGSALNPVVVYVEDATGLNVVTSGTGSNASITITSNAAPANPPSAPLGGITTVSAASGVATFSDLVLTQVGTTALATTKYNYTLTASSGGIASASSNQAITIVPGAATQLVFSIQPVSGTAAGSALASVVVYVEDATGLNVATSGAGSNAPITINSTTAPATPVAAPVTGMTTVTAAGGVAVFNNLILTQVGTTPLAATKYSYRLTAASGGLTSANSSPAITIVPGTAAQLGFNTQPTSGTTAGSALAAVVVYVEDATGLNVAPSDSSTVNMAISTVALTGQGGFTGDSTPTATASGGVATFANLKPTRSGTLVLTASDGTLTAATSSSFVVAGDSAGLPPGSVGASNANPLSITGNSSSTIINLLGPGPTDGVTFAITCGSITVPNVTCVPAPSVTTGTVSGTTPITLTFGVIRPAGAAAANPNNSPTLGTQMQRSPHRVFALLLAIGLFGVGSFGLVQLHRSRAGLGFAFVFLLCLAIAWMSACTQFAAPNTPGAPVNPTPTGVAGLAIVTIAPSGAGPGSDAFGQLAVKVYFQVE